jgi:hypothetical protein
MTSISASNVFHRFFFLAPVRLAFFAAVFFFAGDLARFFAAGLVARLATALPPFFFAADLPAFRVTLAAVFFVFDAIRFIGCLTAFGMLFAIAGALAPAIPPTTAPTAEPIGPTSDPAAPKVIQCRSDPITRRMEPETEPAMPSLLQANPDSPEFFPAECPASQCEGGRSLSLLRNVPTPCSPWGINLRAQELLPKCFAPAKPFVCTGV